MATLYIRYPVSSGGGGGPEQAVTPNGGPLPSEIKIVGGYDGTNCQVLSTDSAGYLNVNAAVTFPSSITVDQATAANLNATAYQGGTWTVDAVQSGTWVVTAEGSTINNDVFGTAIVNSRYNQLEISFDTAPGSSLITNTTTGTGSVTNTNGHQLYSTGTSAGQAKGVSVGSVKYRPGAEIYAYFTASFTAGVANSHQRIGIFDTNNGFYIGYENVTFGTTLRSGATNTFTARTSWSGDPLDGSSTSKFTRNGIPEAINFSFSNVFRIRFGWLGSACVFYEVLSPDEEWIVFNQLRIPNTQLNPSIQNPDLPMTIDCDKTSGTTNLIMSTGCWAAGASSNVQPITTTLTDNSLATLTRSVITGYSSAGGGSYNNVKVTPSGSLTVAIGDITGIVGQQTMANSLPVAIASNQSAIPVSQSGTWNINNISGTISLPTGAATESTLSTLNSKIPSGLTVTSTRLLVDGSGVTQPVSGSVSVSNFPATQVVSGTIAATQSGNWSSRTQDGSGNSITSTTNALDINIKSSNITFGGPGGRSSFLLYRNQYSSSNVNTSTYVVISASLPSNCNIIDIYDSSGQTMVLATGAPPEVQKAYIYPGGPGQIPLAIPAGTRVVYRAVSGTAVSGEINMTFYT